MELRGVLRRARLSLVASLFLAILFPVAPAPAAALPGPVRPDAASTVVVVAPAASDALAPATVADLPEAALPVGSWVAGGPVLAVLAVALVLLLVPAFAVYGRGSRLKALVSGFAVGPRAPPAVA